MINYTRLKCRTHTHTLKSPKVFFQTSPVIMFFVSCPVLSPVS